MPTLSSLFPGASFNLDATLIVSVLMGGAASYAAGRALAQGWRSQAMCFLHALLIAFSAAFLHYALFQDVALSLTRLAGAFAELGVNPTTSVVQLARALGHFAVIYLLQIAFAITGYRMTRASQMAGQYGFDRSPPSDAHPAN